MILNKAIFGMHLKLAECKVEFCARAHDSWSWDNECHCAASISVEVSGSPIKRSLRINGASSSFSRDSRPARRHPFMCRGGRAAVATLCEWRNDA